MRSRLLGLMASCERRGKMGSIEIMQAPNCEGSTLSYPPRIVRDAEGFQRVQLKGIDGWEDEGVVEYVTRLEARGLVLVVTADTVYLMTAQDYDHPLEEHTVLRQRPTKTPPNHNRRLQRSEGPATRVRRTCEALAPGQAQRTMARGWGVSLYTCIENAFSVHSMHVILH